MDYRIADLFRAVIKSTQLQRLETTRLCATGIEDDRRFMVVKPNGDHLSQRELPHMALIKATMKESPWGPTLSSDHDSCSPLLVTMNDMVEAGPAKVTVHKNPCDAFDCGEAAARWLTHLLRQDPDWARLEINQCRLVAKDPQHVRPVSRNAGFKDAQVGFADSQQLLVISTGSLEEVNRRLAKMGADVRASWANFRPSVVIDGAAGIEDMLIEVAVNGLRWRATKSCKRCPIVTVDPTTGKKAAHKVINKALAEYRKRSDVLTAVNAERFAARSETDGPNDLMLGMYFAYVGEGHVDIGDTMRVISREVG